MLLFLLLFVAPSLLGLKLLQTEAALNLPPNLAPNPSFEAGAGNTPTSWHFIPQSPSQSGAWDATVTHTGTHSLKLTSDITQDGQGCHPSGGYWLSDTSIPFQPQRTYYLGVWYRAQSVGSVTSAPSITVLYVDTGGVVLGFETVNANPGSPITWTVGAGSTPTQTSIPAGTVAFKVVLGWASSLTSGACPIGSLISSWYDDLNITEVPSPEPASANFTPGQASVACGASVQLTLDVKGANNQPAADGTLVRFWSANGVVNPASATTVGGKAQTTYTAPVNSGGTFLVVGFAGLGPVAAGALTVTVNCAISGAVSTCMDANVQAAASSWLWSTDYKALGEATITQSPATTAGTTNASVQNVLGMNFTGAVTQLVGSTTKLKATSTTDSALRLELVGVPNIGFYSGTLTDTRIGASLFNIFFTIESCSVAAAPVSTPTTPTSPSPTVSPAPTATPQPLLPPSIPQVFQNPAAVAVVGSTGPHPPTPSPNVSNNVVVPTLRPPSTGDAGLVQASFRSLLNTESISMGLLNGVY